MNEFEVTCITKPNRFSPQEHITHLGNSARGWILTRDEVIKSIESKRAAFYTVDGRTGKRAYVGVVRKVGAAPHLQTHSDGKWNNNLLALAECSGNCRLIG